MKTIKEIKAIFTACGAEEMFDRAIALLRLASQGKDLFIINKGVTSALNPHEEDESVVKSYRKVAGTSHWGAFYSMIGPFCKWDTDVYEYDGSEPSYSNTEYTDGSTIREQWVYMPTFMEAFDWLVTNIAPIGAGWQLTSGEVEPLRFNPALLTALLAAIDGAERIAYMPKNKRQAAAMGLDTRFF